jgi:hypothetical protein
MASPSERFQLSLTKEQIKSLISALWFHENETNEHIDDGAEDLIEHLQRRLRLAESEERERLAIQNGPDYLVGI